MFLMSDWIVAIFNFCECFGIFITKWCVTRVFLFALLLRVLCCVYVTEHRCASCL